MEFRIGINLGDIIVEERRIYGDGVNIAASVEGLADGGGICIPGTAYDQIVSKLDLEFKYLGEQSAKDILEKDENFSNNGGWYEKKESYFVFMFVSNAQLSPLTEQK